METDRTEVDRNEEDNKNDTDRNTVNEIEPKLTISQPKSKIPIELKLTETHILTEMHPSLKLSKNPIHLKLSATQPPLQPLQLLKEAKIPIEEKSQMALTETKSQMAMKIEMESTPVTKTLTKMTIHTAGA